MITEQISMKHEWEMGLGSEQTPLTFGTDLIQIQEFFLLFSNNVIVRCV